MEQIAAQKAMKLQSYQRISIDVAERRALAALPSGRQRPVPASEIAAAIWPTHEMKPQGAGAAASRILKRLERQGKCRWAVQGDWWGWRR
jgi:hypothetical protein